jgi:hypothetical protein
VAQVLAGLHRLDFERTWTVSVEPLRPRRSTEQNARYWAMLTALSEQVPVGGRHRDKEVWHHYFRARFLPARDTLRLPGGVEVPVPISTTTLSVADMGDYMTQIEAWCLEELGWTWHETEELMR